MDRIVLAELLFITPLVLHRLHMQVDFEYTKRFKNLINKLTSNVMQACRRILMEDYILKCRIRISLCYIKDNIRYKKIKNL